MRRKGWQVIRLKVRGVRLHVYPVGDLRRHDLVVECWCKPRAERIRRHGLLVMHNAEDGRELVERHGIN